MGHSARGTADDDVAPLDRMRRFTQLGGRVSIGGMFEYEDLRHTTPVARRLTPYLLRDVQAPIKEGDWELPGLELERAHAEQVVLTGRWATVDELSID